jgi:hypothetical protein
MGVGFWSFVANILLTIGKRRERSGAEAEAPPDRSLVPFITFSVLAILVGTVQGVIQILDPVEEWLEEAQPAGFLVTPLAHAQLNMVGFAIVSLMTLSVFVLPRILGRAITDPVAGRRALLFISAGIACSYLVYMIVGLLESMAIHGGMTPVEARQAVAGTFGRYALFVGVQAIVGVGYLLLFRHVSSVVGRETVRAYWSTFRGRMGGAARDAVRVHPRALTTNPADAQRRALTSGIVEAVGFMGVGWLYSGRPFIGIMLLGGWIAGFLTFMYVVLAVAGGAGALPFLLVLYYAFTISSGVVCYRSYLRQTGEQIAA